MSDETFPPGEAESRDSGSVTIATVIHGLAAGCAWMLEHVWGIRIEAAIVLLVSGSVAGLVTIVLPGDVLRRVTRRLRRVK